MIGKHLIIGELRRLGIRIVLITILVPIFTWNAAGCPAPSGNDTDLEQVEETIKLATTTSCDNSGLLEHLLPVFTDATGISVEVIAVGTGAALELGRAGDVDIILVHSPEDEAEFIAGGFGLDRHYVAQNEFVVVGPESDPGDVKSITSAAEAFSNILGAEARFISRGDNSGTHKRELQVWESMGFTPEGEWYIESGQGMGAVLTMASEMQAYTLTDTGTFYAMSGNLDLVICFSGDPILENIYSIIPLNPEIHPDLKHSEAMELVDWITGDEAAEMIGDFRINGEVLFRVERR